MKRNIQLFLLIFVFFISGFSALVYQVAWQRILTLYYSVENISTTLIVSVYMLGLGLGAIIGGALTEKIKNRITFYFFIELLIGFFGYISIPFLNFLGRHTAGSSYFTSFILMFAFLCVPTFLMGMTLPLLTKIFNRFLNNFFGSLSYLYFINTLGAAFGSLVASYLLISLLGLDTPVYIAATTNICIAVIVLAFIRDIQHHETPPPPGPASTATVYFPRLWMIYAIVFVTGFTAIGYEIIWFRLIGLLVKASAYSFSSVLFIYLLGIAIGSFYMKRYLHKRPAINKKHLFALLQVGIAVYVLASIIIYRHLVQHVPFFFQLNYLSFDNIIHPALTRPDYSSALAFAYSSFPIIDIIAWPLAFIFIPTCFMGASFPLITAIAYRPGSEARTVGNIYFFNVLGNVAGGLFTGLLLLQVLGSERTLLLFSAIGIMFLFMHSGGILRRLVVRVAVAVIIMAPAAMLFPAPTELYATTHPRFLQPDNKKLITEGVDGIITSYYSGPYLTTYINGISHGGRPGQPFYHRALQAMSFKKELKNVLVIGFGTGSMVEALLSQKPRPQITLVELSHTLIDNLEQTTVLNDILHSKQVDLVYADGRKFLYNTNKKFDAIFIDPLYSTTSFSNNLYSKQFFDLVSGHLEHDGIFLVWCDNDKVIPRTICTVFPYVKQYDHFSVASKSQLIDDNTYKLQLFAGMPAYQAELLKIDSMHHTCKTRDIILAETNGYPINEDYKPRAEYYLGLPR